jgi:hypothetical protein
LFLYPHPPRPQKLDLSRISIKDTTRPSGFGSAFSQADEKSPQADNPAKQIARRLYGCLPVIYGAAIAAEAAHRWKTQLNENSKAWAFYEVFPELNHNATVGFPCLKK